VKNESGDLLADSHIFLNRWKKYFSQLLSVYNISDGRQIGVHRAGTLVPGPSRFEVEIAFATLEKFKSPGSDEIPSELIQAGGETVQRSIKSFMPFGIRKNCLFSGRSILLYQRTNSVATVGCTNGAHIFFFFLNPLLFASCTNTFSKCCEITTTTDMKRSAQ
jgi:hypothetical protein